MLFILPSTPAFCPVKLYVICILTIPSSKLQGERDYAALPAGVPKWKGNLPVGHGGTYTQVNGGKFGIAASYWVSWLLRGNTTASSYFTGSGAKNDGWTVEMANLDKISVTPI